MRLVASSDRHSPPSRTGKPNTYFSYSENARKNAKIFNKKQSELDHLRWMISNEGEKTDKLAEVQKERFEKLKDQKKLNFQLQKKMLEIQKRKNEVKIESKVTATGEVEHKLTVKDPPPAFCVPHSNPSTHFSQNTELKKT